MMSAAWIVLPRPTSSAIRIREATPCVRASAGSSWNDNSEMRARSGVRRDDHEGVASARIPRVSRRHRPRRTRRGGVLRAKPFDDLEGKEERRAGIEVRSIPASNLQDRRVDAGCRARDHPAFIADANRLAGNEW